MLVMDDKLGFCWLLVAGARQQTKLVHFANKTGSPMLEGMGIMYFTILNYKNLSINQSFIFNHVVLMH